MDELNIKDKKIFEGHITDNLNNIYGHLTDKIQRLTGALYRVTDLLSDKEPLKWALRDKAMVVYNNLMSIRFIKDKSSVFDDTLGCLFQIIKSLELVSVGFYVSNLNFEILKREYADLRNFIEGKKSNIITEQKLLLGFPARREGARKKQESAGLKVAAGDDNASFSVGFGVSISGSEGRKGKILEFMEMGGERTMGEIASIFNGEISEKAVQRELFDLVKSGKLIAKGDKRWRKYKFNEQLSQPIALDAPKERPQKDEGFGLTINNI